MALFLPESGKAAVPYKDCEGCHVLFAGLKGKGARKKQDALCVNCHTNAGGETIKMIGDIRIPIVNNTEAPLKPLAGGNFYYVSRLGSRKGHNVGDITPPDTKFIGLPPGYDSSYDASSIKYNDKKPLACAGSNGCHGNRNIESPFQAISGAHHGDDAPPLDGSTISKSYRFLKITDAVKGVTGLEDEDWGQNSTSIKHNEYSALMSALCRNCHGDFHGKSSEKVWFRHPVGVTLPDRGEYKNYTTYNPNTPVGRTVIPGAASSTVTPGLDVVICLSCHVAHGGPNDSMLRWNFSDFVAGKGSQNGCFICHSKKK